VTSVGIDVGGTTIKGVRLDDAGAIVDAVDNPTTPDDPDTLVATIISQAAQLGVGPRVPLGVAVAGFVDPGRRIVQFSPNISWRHRALADELSEKIGVGVVLDNDANAACYGEYWQGAGRGATNVAMFTLGTGVGGAVMESGRLLVGASGVAGELGHIPINAEGGVCGCGLVGCLETVASGTAIVQRARQISGIVDATPDEVEALLAADSALREGIFADVSEAVARAIVVVRAVTNPDTVVIGGGVTERAGSFFIEMISQRVTEYLRGASLSAAPKVVAASLGNRAGGIGAALLAKDRASDTL